MYVDLLCTDSNVNLESELDVSNLRAASPTMSTRRGSQCSQVIDFTRDKTSGFIGQMMNRAGVSGCIFTPNNVKFKKAGENAVGKFHHRPKISQTSMLTEMSLLRSFCSGL